MLDVSPNPSSLDVVDMTEVEAALLSDDRPESWVTTDSEYIGFCEFRVMGIDSPSGIDTSAIRAVLKILPLSASTKVFGVDATGVVAGVQDEQSVRDRAGVHLVGKSVGKDLLIIQVENPVPSGATTAAPFPAEVSPFDLGVKSGNGVRFGWGHEYSVLPYPMGGVTA